MEPILDNSPLENQSQPISVQTDGSIENNPIKPPNTMKIGLFIFLGIIVFLIVTLGYTAYNYQGIPKPTPEKKDIFTPYDANYYKREDIKPEEKVEPISQEVTNSIESSSTPENQEVLPPLPKNRDYPGTGSDEIIAPDVCADGSCNNGCGPTEYWNGIKCLEAGKYKTHATQCVTNSASNLPSGYFVAHFLWDSGDCAGDDYNVGDYSNMNGIRATDKCQSGEMICKKNYSDSCVLGAGICTCYDPKIPSIQQLSLNESVVFAAGGSEGIETNHQIDDGGEFARIYTVKVNYTEKPVTLVLGSYSPGIWNISISEGTKISKIILGGYYGQKIAGISKNIPIEEHIYQYKKTNDYFYISQGETTKSSLKKWGNVQAISYSKNGEILIGNPPSQNTKWIIQDPKNTPEKYYNIGDNLAGEAGLELLVQKGVLRVATPEDAIQWFDALRRDPNSYFSKKEGYPITDVDDLAILQGKYTSGVGLNYYVALKDFTLPGGMYWKFSFYVPKGITVRGDISNGTIYDYNTMDCRGSCIQTH